MSRVGSDWSMRRGSWVERRRGITTALALRYLAEAIETPDEWIYAKDHVDLRNAHRNLFDLIHHIAQSLRLDMEFDPRKLRLRSTHKGVLVNTLTNEIKEEP